jgi:inosine-uridine nucleoside N-ribohydrolase
MARKIIVDSDMGTDDAVAICMLLFQPDLEIVALTATEGCVSATQANCNLQAILAAIDPPRYPRLGMATETEDAPPINSSYLYGDDGLGNSHLKIPSKQHLMSAEKVIIESFRRDPGRVTYVALGPLTNLARALRRDPSIEESIDQIIIVGGSVSGAGNITAAAEFNFYFDPQSARQILQSRTTKILIPLDVTQQLQFGLDLFEQLPAEDSRVGSLCREILPFTFRSFRQRLGRETITLNDVVGALAVVDPTLFDYTRMAGDVETEGELTRGASVFDLRTVPEWRPNVDVATSIDVQRAKEFILRSLKNAGRMTT